MHPCNTRMVGEGKEANRIWRGELQRRSEEAGGEFARVVEWVSRRGAIEKMGGSQKEFDGEGGGERDKVHTWEFILGKEREKKNVVDGVWTGNRGEGGSTHVFGSVVYCRHFKIVNVSVSNTGWILTLLVHVRHASFYYFCLFGHDGGRITDTRFLPSGMRVCARGHMCF